MKKDNKRKNKGVVEGDSSKPVNQSLNSGFIVFSKWKELVFRILSVLFPFLVLLIFEIGLRIAGAGYPTRFFLQIYKNGKSYYIENQYFGYRFFPPPLARTPEPMIVATEKPTNTYRIVVFGESAALGDPAPAFSFARMLETLLNEQIGGLKFEVINVSMTAINSHVLLEIAKDCKKLNADLWLLYIGNNEVIGPFSPATIFTLKQLPYPVIRLIIGLKEFRTVQLFHSVIEKLAPGNLIKLEWGGMEMFLKNQIRYQDKSLESVYANFERNISKIIMLGQKSGADVLLVSPLANYRNCAPFGSMHREGLSDKELQQWNVLFDAGKKLEINGKYSEAINLFKKAEEIDNTHAELLFRLARCIEKTATDESGIKEAERYYLSSVDYDTMRFRPDSRILAVIKSVAQFYQKSDSSGANRPLLRYIDTLMALRDRGIRIPGNEILWEHVHLNFTGNYLLASIYAGKVIDMVKFRATSRGLNFSIKSEMPDANVLFEKIGLTDYDKLKVYREMVKRLGLPPFSYRINQAEEIEKVKSEIEILEEKVKSTDIQKYVAQYEKCLSERDGDFILRQRYAELLDEFGIYDRALEQWEFIKAIIPHYPNAYLQIGNLLDKTGRSLEAIQYFETALKKNPKSAEVYSSSGLCLLNLNRYDEAISSFKNALKLKPDLPAIYVNLSLAYSAKGDLETAKQQCLNAIRISSNYTAAYLNLGKYYAMEGKHELALSNYLKVVSIDNNNAIGYYNVANALSRAGRKQEALTNYLRAITLNPNFGEAHLNLAFEFLDLKDGQSALKHFHYAAQLLTNNVIAQINYGIALARSGRFNEAAVYLEKALSLDPSDPQIHYNLGLLYAKMGQRDKAIIELSRTIELKPDHREARAQLDKIVHNQ